MLRTPFFVIALLMMVVVLFLELGSGFFLGGDGAGAELRQAAEERDVEIDGSTADIDEPPGRALGYLALVDGVLLYTVLLIGASLVLPERFHARAQGVATLIVSIVLIIVAFILAIIAFIELLVMVALFFAFPFGTIAYLAVWGFFPRSEAAAVLSLLMFLKLAFCVFLVLAQQRFLQQKGIIALVLTTLLCYLIVGFLHGLVPIVLVSIVDTLSALVIAIIAIIWGILLLIGSIPSIVSTIRLGAAHD